MPLVCLLPIMSGSLDLIVCVCLTLMGPNEAEQDDYYWRPTYTQHFLRDHLTLNAALVPTTDHVKPTINFAILLDAVKSMCGESKLM